MSLWGRVFAAGYDRFLGASERAGLRERRRELLGEVHGRVLEIGAGTGANLALYPDAVDELVLTEPEEPMARQLRAKLARLGRSAEVVSAPAEQLPFEDGSFDFVVSTLVLCTVAEPTAALSELARVLKPDGRFLFIEHVRSPDAGLARWQDRLHPLWLRFGHGCHCNRDTLQAIAQANFELGEVQRGEIPKAVPIVRPSIAGSAQPAASR